MTAPDYCRNPSTTYRFDPAATHALRNTLEPERREPLELPVHRAAIILDPDRRNVKMP